MNKILFFLILITSSNCVAGQFTKIELFNLEFIHLRPARDAMIYYGFPGEEITNRLSINSRVLFYNTVYWSNTFEAATGWTQFREAGWRVEVGAAIPHTPADVFLYHHSQHFLDETGGKEFPSEDGVGLRINLVN